MPARRIAATAGTVALPSLNAAARAVVQVVPDRPRDLVRDHRVERGIADLMLGQPGGAPVAHLLVLGQLEAVQELGSDVGQAQAAALGAERQARHLQGAIRPAQVDAAGAEHRHLEARCCGSAAAGPRAP